MEMKNVRKLTLTQKTNLVAKHVQKRLDDAANPDTETTAPTAKELAAIMVHSYASLDDGDPLDMVRIDPATGATATRELTADTPMWTIKTPGDPNISYSTEPTLVDWTVVYDPTAKPAAARSKA